jgi:SAM-dependent methyltransferase
MAQNIAWEREYKKPTFLTKKNEPQQDVVRFVRFLKKEGIDIKTSVVVDLGSGTGRNSNYFASFGAKVYGVEISKTAVAQAEKEAQEKKLRVSYCTQSMADHIPVGTAGANVIIDITSSNSLTETERVSYIDEIQRILKPGGFLFVKALAKDGDQNAKNLLKKFPGKEIDTYVMPETGIIERVFSREDFLEVYKNLTSVFLEKKTSYSRFGNQPYRRNFWIAYFQKPM